MPQCWVKVPRGTSVRLRTCLGAENSDQNFERCVHEIVQSHQGTVLKFHHPGHSRFSHVRFDAPDESSKGALMVDLDAEEIEDPEQHGA
jgi:hypothetical protein